MLLKNGSPDSKADFSKTTQTTRYREMCNGFLIASPRFGPQPVERRGLPAVGGGLGYDTIGPVDSVGILGARDGGGSRHLPRHRGAPGEGNAIVD